MLIVGKVKSELETPALWVDLDLMEQNIHSLADYFLEAGVSWRPHTKGIKVPAIAHMLLDAGAIGVTCAKLAEAEVMAAAGVKSILIANQVVGEMKTTRLANLRRRADVMVAVDSLVNVRQISRAAVEAGVTVGVLIEVNAGMNRCGLEPGAPVVEFAREVVAFQGIRLAGLISWEGHVVSVQDPQEKKQRCEESVRDTLRSAELCRTAGYDVPIVSCGGSGTYRITSHIPGVTEIQAGGAIFTDLTYLSYGVNQPCSLFLLTTVVSRPAADRAVVDAGRKTMNYAGTLSQPRETAGARLVGLNAEHGILALDGPDVSLEVGDKIDLTVGYGDTTLHLHDHLYGVRHDKVEVVWDIQGRGKLT